MRVEKRRSGFWFLLPIFLNLIGGIISYFVIKEDDPSKAKNCLYLGAILTAFWVFLFFLPLILGFSVMPDNGIIIRDHYRFV